MLATAHNALNIKILTVFFLSVSCSGAVQVRLAPYESISCRQLVQETTAIIRRHLRDEVRSVVIFADAEGSELQDMIVRSLHATLPVVLLDAPPALGCSSCSQTPAFVLLSDKGRADLYLQRLAQVAALTAWSAQALVVYVDASYHETDGMHFELLKISWVRYETADSLVISVSRRNVVAKRFNQFVSHGEIIDVTRPGELLGRPVVNAMGYPFKITPVEYFPFAYVVTKPGGERVLGGMMGDISQALTKLTSCSITTDLDSTRRMNTSQWVPSDRFNETFDMILPFTILQSRDLKNSLYPYMFEQLVLIVPKAQKMPGWITAFLPFNYELWIMYLCCYPVIVVLESIFSHFNRKDTQHLYGSLEVFRLFFLGASHHPVVSSSLRLYFISVMAFNIVVNNAYTGSVTSYLTVPQYYPDINSVDEIESKGLSVGLPVKYGSNIELDVSNMISESDFEDKTSATLLNHMTVISSVEDGVRDVINHRNLSILHISSGAKYEVSRTENLKNSQPLLHIAEKDIFPLYVVAVLRNNFPYLNIINRGVWYYREAGFVDKITRKDFQRVFLKFEKAGENITPFNMEQLQSYFYLLVIGYIVSILGFIIELIYAKMFKVFIEFLLNRPTMSCIDNAM